MHSEDVSSTLQTIDVHESERDEIVSSPMAAPTPVEIPINPTNDSLTLQTVSLPNSPIQTPFNEIEIWENLQEVHVDLSEQDEDLEEAKIVESASDSEDYGDIFSKSKIASALFSVIKKTNSPQKKMWLGPAGWYEIRFSTVVLSEHGAGTLLKGSKVYVMRLERTRGFITQPCRGWILRDCLFQLRNPDPELLTPNTLDDFNPFFRDLTGVPFQIQNINEGKLEIRATQDLDSAVVAQVSQGSIVLVSLIAGNFARVSRPIRGWATVKNDKGISFFKKVTPEAEEFKTKMKGLKMAIKADQKQEIQRLEAELAVVEKQSAKLSEQFADSGVDVNQQRLGNMRGREEDLLQFEAYNDRLESMRLLYQEVIEEQGMQTELLETMVQHLASIKLGVIEKSPLFQSVVEAE